MVMRRNKLFFGGKDIRRGSTDTINNANSCGETLREIALLACSALDFDKVDDAEGQIVAALSVLASVWRTQCHASRT